MLISEPVPEHCVGPYHAHTNQPSPRQDLGKLQGRLRPGTIPQKQDEPGHSVSEERNSG